VDDAGDVNAAGGGELLGGVGLEGGFGIGDHGGIRFSVRCSRFSVDWGGLGPRLRSTSERTPFGGMTRIRFGGFGYDPSQSLRWDAPVVTGGYTSGEGDWQVVRGR
jgi:hypothetical protein